MTSNHRIEDIVGYALEYNDEKACEYFDILPDTLQRYKHSYRTAAEEDIRLSREITKDGQTITIKSYEIHDLDELLQYCKVNLEQWEVTRHVVNSWGGAANPCFQVKAWLSRRKQEIDEKAEIKQLIIEAKKYAPQYPIIADIKRPANDNMLEISLFDHHFGQLSWGEETGGQNYDIKIAREIAITAVDYILSRAKEIDIDLILLPVGNDFFNVNSSLETTVAGTKQSEDDRWKKTFLYGRQLWVGIIEKCRAIAPVVVKIIPGNHDGEKIFYLGEALECWFANTDNVEIDNSPVMRKYFEWGKCFIGYTHGDKEVKGTLVNIMATEKPLEWSRTIYREWHKGHWHAAKAQAFQILDEQRGVREWILPSLVAIDDWHSGKGYSALRETIAMVWNKERGKTDMFMYHPENLVQ